MVQAGVFRNVAISGIQPCSRRGDSTIPVQNIPWVCAVHSWGSMRQASSKLKKIDGIEPREARLVVARLIEFTGPRARRVVVGHHEAGEQNEVAHRRIARH